MAEYINAVSDQLVVSLFPHAQYYHIFNNQRELKWGFRSTDLSFPEALNGAIFSKTHCIQHQCRTVLVPVTDRDHPRHFELSYGKSASLIHEDLESLSVVYEPLSDVFTMRKSLVNPVITCDVAVLLKQLDQREGDTLYLFPDQRMLSVLLVRDGVVQLMNRYPIKDQDELFYFVMLVVEQMGVRSESVDVKCACASKDLEHLNDLFRNYLPRLQPTNEPATNDHTTQEVQALYLAQCVL